MNDTQAGIEAHERTHLIIAAATLVADRIKAGDKVINKEYFFDEHTEDKAIAALAYSFVFHYATTNIGNTAYSQLTKIMRQYGAPYRPATE